MKRTHLVILFIAVLLLPQLTHAEEKKLKKDGFDTTIYWFQNRDVLKIDGTVKGKLKKCGNLNITVFMFNKRDQDIQRLDTTIERYRGQHYNNFDTAVKLSSSNGHTGDWYLKNIFFDCI